MKKTTSAAVTSFIAGFETYNKRINVERNSNIVKLRLLGKTIAVKLGDEIKITDAGHRTNETKEALNGLLSELNVEEILQKDSEWFWKGSKFPCGEFVKITS